MHSAAPGHKQVSQWDRSQNSARVREGAGTCTDEVVQIYRPPLAGKVSEHLERRQSHSTSKARLGLIG